MKSNSIGSFSRGYTVMEILAVISIVSIFVSVLGQASNNFFSAQTVSASARTLVDDVRLARYGAMSEQHYYRLFFTSDGAGYSVQVYDDAPIISSVDFSASLTDINSPKWGNAIDSPIREFDPEVTFLKPPTLNVIFFRYDGMLVSEPTGDSPPIPDFIATFTYGSAVLTVNINAAGVMASEEYYEPE
ncbi:prepilin-type N-terminal cleavage/methylation domain-containing protein [bacterium]|nr:prepilin-type N-terminal cleavage/methylation domain-containing protein [bacterium]